MSFTFHKTLHDLKAGDIIRRGLHNTSRFTLGRGYRVEWVNADRSLAVIDDNGTNTRTHANLYHPVIEGELMNYQNQPRASAQCAPAPSYQAPPLAPVYNPGQQVSVEEMRALADRVEAEQQAHEAAALAAKADRDERIALNNAIHEHKNLASATITLLSRIRSLLVEREAVPAPSDQIAQHRKALAGLAEVYGVKIVLVGDKTSATVVKA